MEVHNHGGRPRRSGSRWTVAADFADLFEVKEGSAAGRAGTGAEPTASGVRLGGPTAGLAVSADVPPRAGGRGRGCCGGGLGGRARQLARVAGGRFRWCGATRSSCTIRGGLRRRPRRSRRLRGAWQRQVPRLETADPLLARVVARGVADLAACASSTPSVRSSRRGGRGAVVHGTVRPGLPAHLPDAAAAGPGPRAGHVRALARRQGSRVDPLTEEQPGRILHELSFGPTGTLALDGRGRTTAPPTRPRCSWWSAGRCWTGPAPKCWIPGWWPPATGRWPGWRSTATVTGTASSSTSGAPRAGCATRAGRTPTTRSASPPGSWPSRRSPCARCRPTPTPPGGRGPASPAPWGTSTRRCTGSPRRGAAGTVRGGVLAPRAATTPWRWTPASAGRRAHLEPRPRAVERHRDTERAAEVAGHLMSPEMFTGWGVRTLATTARRYDPMSYHNGSVWPHDTALAAAGLARYGFYGAARSLAAASSGRPGTSTTGSRAVRGVRPGPVPVPFPTRRRAVRRPGRRLPRVAAGHRARPGAEADGSGRAADLPAHMAPLALSGIASGNAATTSGSAVRGTRRGGGVSPRGGTGQDRGDLRPCARPGRPARGWQHGQDHLVRLDQAGRRRPVRAARAPTSAS